MFTYLKEGEIAQHGLGVKQVRNILWQDHNVSLPRETSIAPETVEEYGFSLEVSAPIPEHDTTTHLLRGGSLEKVDGVWTRGWVLEPIVVIPEAIRPERDRRLALDFQFQGKMFQRDAKSVARISGAGTLALGAIVAGAQVGDLLWHGRDTPFAWIASDDSLVTMDAQTCFAFGQAAAARETEIVFAAKTLREMDPIPTNFRDDEFWP